MDEASGATTLEKEILDAAEAKVAAILEGGERITARVARHAEARAQELLEEARRAVEPRERAERARALAIVELEMKRQEAIAREAFVEGVLAGARNRLRAWRDRPDAEQIIIGLVEEAIRLLPGNRFVAELPPADLDRFGPAISASSAELSARLGREVRISAAAGRPAFDAIGGARVVAEDGRTCVDQTFEARLARLADELRHRMQREIFSAAGSRRTSDGGAA